MFRFLGLCRVSFISLIFIMIFACSGDDMNDEPQETEYGDADTDDTAGDDDADSDNDNDNEGLEGEICPENGSFDHHDAGTCAVEGSDDPGANCPAGSLCFSDEHCVGQGGGEGSPLECRTLNCGVIDCADECTCVSESVCECPEE